MKYIACAKCMGRGYIICPVCHGTKRRTCSKCKGRGWNKQKGPCPVCKSSKRVACQACASLKDVAKKVVDNLEKLHEDGILTDDEYYRQRRLLTAQAKYRMKVMARRKKIEEERLASGKADGKEKAIKIDKSSNREAERTKLKMLAEAFGNRAISLELYRKKVALLGLSDKELLDMEKQIGSTIPRMKRYLELKMQFRDGKIDRQEFSKRVKQTSGGVGQAGSR